MKKILIASLLAAGLALSSHAQGLVLFTGGTQNITTNNTLVQLGAIASGKTSGAGNFYYALFYSATATTVSSPYAFLDSNWTAVTSDIGASSATAGRFLPQTPNGDGSTTILNVAAGSTAQFVVVGWSASLASSLSQLESLFNANGVLTAGAGFIGQSVVSGPISLGNGGSLPTPALFGNSSPLIQGFVLNGVVAAPEPGTIALAGLGIAGLLALRRKK
ncbi:MAG TPA: PEP-CTERM sorting domain-containing protein [Verrucomicrobiae bacterium]|jgi:hypothetical protein